MLRVYDLAKLVVADAVRFACKYVQIGKNAYDPAKLPMVEELVKIYREKATSPFAANCADMLIGGALEVLAEMNQ